jgi:hypothetical protein
MWWLSLDDALLLQDVPSIFEWVAASCGVMSKAERNALAIHFSGPLKKKLSELISCRIERISIARDAIKAID